MNTIELNVESKTTPFSKMNAQLELLRVSFHSQKRMMESTMAELKQLEKMVSKMEKKHMKIENKPKKKRKPCGFAVPTQITPELCSFLGKEPGFMIARTEVTKFLMKYIAEHNLQNPAKKREIILNDTLIQLLGEEAKTQTITHFTIQKYMNPHFVNAGHAVATTDSSITI